MLEITPTQSTVWDRFCHLLAEGELAPLAGTGLIEESLVEISCYGRRPTDEFLGKLTVTSVSTEWLLHGRGSPHHPPFIAKHDEEAADHLDELLWEDGIRINLFTSASHRLIVCTSPCETPVRNQLVRHRAIEVIAGSIGPELLARVEAAKSTHEVVTEELSAEGFGALLARFNLDQARDHLHAASVQ